MRYFCCVCKVEYKPEDKTIREGHSHGYCQTHYEEARNEINKAAARWRKSKAEKREELHDPADPMG